MAKVKTSKSVGKRFKFSAKGKLKRKKAYHSHILTKKSMKRKRALRKADFVDKVDTKRIRRLLPYG